MSDRLDRAHRYHAAIHDILIRDWDPIGVGDDPGAEDEYDGYIYQIDAMLIAREPRERLVEYLWWAENEHMALFGNLQRTEAIADRLLDLRDRIEANEELRPE